jgi:hypothetical protein
MRLRSAVRGKGVAAGLGLLVGLVLGAGGLAWASIPSPSGQIQGCYKNTSPHTLQVIDTAKVAKCPSGTTALAWNQSGPAGPPGPAINRAQVSVGTVAVPTYATGDVSTATPVVLASKQFTVTGTGPQLVEVFAQFDPTKTVTWDGAQILATPCGQAMIDGGIGSFQPGYLGVSRSDGAEGDLGAGVQLVQPGTYTFQLVYRFSWACVAPDLTQPTKTWNVGGAMVITQL